MAQNTSPAVMARRFEPNDSLEDFPTPPWGTRALVKYVIEPNFYRGLGLGTAWDPAANRGYMARPLEESFEVVFASDVHDYGLDGCDVHDFLQPRLPRCVDCGADWIITNPPFRLGPQFIFRALDVAQVGVAMLVRTAFLEGQTRYKELFSKTPPTIVAQFAERIVLTKGIVRDPNKSYLDERTGKWKRPSTATAYCWLIWVKGEDPRPFQWLPPCRLRLERPEDYPA